MKMKEKTQKKSFEKEKGITLIALVITIIVLLILAGVSIATLTGQNGILTRATDSKIQSEYSSVKEGFSLVVSEYTAATYTDEEAPGPFLDWLQQRGYIDENKTINVGQLLGETLSTGNGDPKGTIDVYKIEEVVETGKLASTVKVAATQSSEETTYKLVYYDEEGNRNELSTFSLSNTSQLGEIDMSLFEVDEYGEIYLKEYNDYYEGRKEWTIEHLIIPSEVNGKKVTTIRASFLKEPYEGKRQFQALKTITISEGILNINKNAFRGLEKLENVYLPDTLTNIGEGAFYGCTSLADITIPEAVTNIDEGTFYGCTSLANITIPDSVTNIGESAFYGCTSLANITIPDSVISIGPIAFASCTSLTNITIPSSVTTMGGGNFLEWTSSQTIHVPFASEDSRPSGWDEDWNGGEAQIDYLEE